MNSPTPPPTSHCPHVSSLLNLPLIRQRFRSRTFQNAYTQNRLECCDCNVHFPTEHLWACLQCSNIDSARCGRFQQKHAVKHFREHKHALAIHLQTRVIWCYLCDAEVPDEYDTAQLQPSTILPQLVRSALDKEDAAAEVEQADDDNVDDAQEEEEEPEEITYKSYLNNPHGGLTGLSNLGNTCYFSAGTQALLHCAPLVAFFSELRGSVEERHALGMLDVHTVQQSHNQETRLKLVEDFSVLMQKSWGGRYHLCVPTDLLKDILMLNSFFRGYGQHDSQEYIRCILDNLHEGTKSKIYYEYDLKRQIAASKEEEERADKEKAEEKEEKEQDASSSSPKPAPAAKRYPECSIIADLFQGTLESSVKCSNCGYVSLTRDPFYDLSLEIPKEQQLKKIGAERGTEALTVQTSRGFFSGLGNLLGISTPTLSLETCLHSFCTSDHLQSKDQYKCDKCKVKVNAVKILSLGTANTLPEVLSLHIKRFSHNSYFGSKIGRHVTFPLYNLDMQPFLTPQPPPPRRANGKSANGPASSSASSLPTYSSSSSFDSLALYDLFAIVRHLGSSNGGHYIAYCKSHVTGKWFEFDDKGKHSTTTHTCSVDKQGSRHKCERLLICCFLCALFASLVVTEISEEKVAKIEAYVLFYGRKHKPTALQRILKQIDAITIRDVHSHPSSSPAAASSSSASSSSSAASPAPAPSTPSSSSKPFRYVSRYWLKKMEVLGRPEPIDNRDLCCPHGLPKPLPKHGGDRAFVVTPAGWESLFAEYGGGPVVDSHQGALCEPCQLPILRKQERARIAAVDALAAKQSLNDPFFLIHSPWLQQWRAFVSAGGPRPGAISNHLLFESDGATLLAGLKRADHYRALHGLVWSELQTIYGGGPVIQRPTVDLYTLEVPPPVVQMSDEEQEEEEEEEAEDEEEEQPQQPQQPPAVAPRPHASEQSPAQSSAQEQAAAASQAPVTHSRSNSANNSAAAQPQTYAYVNQAESSRQP